MGERLDLHELLKTILGSSAVYFQIPENVKMSYPCIRYKLNRYSINYANNAQFNKRKNYEIMLITADVDSPVVSKIQDMPYCTLVRTYVSDNLNHFVFDLYF